MGVHSWQWKEIYDQSSILLLLWLVHQWLVHFSLCWCLQHKSMPGIICALVSLACSGSSNVHWLTWLFEISCVSCMETHVCLLSPGPVALTYSFQLYDASTTIYPKPQPQPTANFSAVLLAKFCVLSRKYWKLLDLVRPPINERWVGKLSLATSLLCLELLSYQVSSDVVSATI